jgi:enamine deaminase RidA (YjgF/YER057c/UK114 family)
MPKQLVTSPRLPPPSGHFAQATIIEAKGRLLFISGMLAKDAQGNMVGIGDIEAQTRQVCENLKAAVEAAGVPSTRVGDANLPGDFLSVLRDASMTGLGIGLPSERL